MIEIKKAKAANPSVVGSSDRLHRTKYDEKAIWEIYLNGEVIGYLSYNSNDWTAWAGPFGGPGLPPEERRLINRGFDKKKDAVAAVRTKYADQVKTGLTITDLRAIKYDDRSPRLKALAQFINDHMLGYRAYVEGTTYSADTKCGRLRIPGVEQSVTILTVHKNNKRVLEHNSGEAYRRNYDVVNWICENYEDEDLSCEWATVGTGGENIMDGGNWGEKGKVYCRHSACNEKTESGYAPDVEACANCIPESCPYKEAPTK